MDSLLINILTQTLTFLPLALGISISYTLLRATDMTLDGSFVLGGGVFAKLVTSGFSPILSAILALGAGSGAGIMVSLIQKKGKIDPLMAGILATFILSSVNLLLMGRPNINLLSSTTLVSSAFGNGELFGWALIAAYCFGFCGLSLLLLHSRIGLILRGVGDNPTLLQRIGHPIEFYRCLGFAFTNMLAAASGLLTVQTIGYADIGMSFGMTLTGIGAICVGQHIMRTFINFFTKRIVAEFSACLIGVVLYFTAVNTLLRFDLNPIYLKTVIGIILIVFLRNSLGVGKMERAL